MKSALTAADYGMLKPLTCLIRNCSDKERTTKSSMLMKKSSIESLQMKTRPNGIYS